MDISRRVILAERPRYIVPTANCFKLLSGPRPEAGSGELRIRTQWLSMDVMLYSRLQKVSGDATPLDIDATMVGPAVGTVEVSSLPDFPVGTLVSGYWGWQEHAISDGKRLRKLDFGVQKPSYGLSHDDMADCFATWNGGRLESYLIEITARILRQRDRDGEFQVHLWHGFELLDE